VKNDLSMPEFFIDRAKKLGLSFALTVCLPVTAAILYFGVFASPVYLSQSQFIVRSPEKKGPSGLGMLLQSTGIGSSTEELSAAQSYLISRDALRQLNKDQSVSRMFSRTSISIFDRFNPTGSAGSFESLYRYFGHHILIDHESASTVTKLTVRAYTAEDAFKINERLLELSEQLVNRLNERAQADAIRFAQRDASEAEAKATNAAIAVSQFRNAQGVLDPEKQAQVQLGMVSKLQDQQIATKMQLAELEAYTPQNPQIAVLKTRIVELSGEIDVELGKVAGGRKSFSSTAVRYQRLMLESQLADRQLAAIEAALVDAKAEARRQQVYVERIVEPNVPDEAQEPRRLRGIFATLILGLVAWGIVSLLLASVREHNG
jgi:capsular polysaccharide transport system permease protein